MCVSPPSRPPGLFPNSPPPWASTPKHNKVENRPINSPMMTSKCLNERKGCTSVTLIQKLEMTVMVSEKGEGRKLRKAKSLGLFPKQLTRLWMQRQSSWRKSKCYSSGHMNGKKEPTDDMRKCCGLDRDQTSYNIPLSQSITLKEALTLLNSVKAERDESSRRKAWSHVEVGSWGLRKLPP